jgi:predicted nuclease of predicted toxin-antitoxin system
MFKFYANENLSLMLVNKLRQLGHDVMTSYEAGNANQRIPDEQVLAESGKNNRCVLTFNRDDFVKLHRSGIDHKGIIICKDDRDYQGQASVLAQYLNNQEKLNNRLIRILKQNQKGSNQPIFVVKEY